LPPSRSERLSLSSFAKSPNLNEHFRKAIFVFSDDTYAELEGRLRQRGEPRKAPERGVLLAQEWDSVARNFIRSFHVRLVRDLLGDRSSYGLLYAAVNGLTLGNVDIVYDPRSPEQITVGQIASGEERSYFNIWTRFPTRAFRQGRHALPAPDVAVKVYRIEATLDPTLRMSAATEATVVPGAEGKRALSFDISPQMRVSQALIDGVPAEVFQPESLRSTMIRGTANETFLVIPPKPLEPGREYQVRFTHEGNVVTDAGNRVYYVGSRGVWYPNRQSQFARYDLTFRYPLDLDLVATGKADEVETEGTWRVSRFRTDAPVRLVGFNLGEYERETVNRSGYSIDVYANRNVEAALAQPQRRVIMLPPQLPAGGRHAQPRWTVDIQPVPIDTGARSGRLHRLALEIAGALEFMSGHFGPPVLKHLTVAPIPGAFGQGFPGLIYLSTLAYLDPNRRPELARDEYARTFYTEILHAHETAHQWWGNIVTSSQDEDDWLMEALANYSALLYLEKRKGARPLESVLTVYRDHLLTKDRDGTTIESAGPIVWGSRLITSQAPIAWRIITYEKGSWIMHMLRHRIGDARFLAMLGQLRKRYQYKGVSTEEFRRLAAEFLPPKSPDPDLEGFFEQFVYSTGVPSFKLDYSIKGSAPRVRVSGTVTQTGVDEDFSTYVPVEIQFAKGKPSVQWIRTTNGPTPFDITLRQAPSKVVLDPAGSILKK
jgi:hypothetical protein